MPEPPSPTPSEEAVRAAKRELTQRYLRGPETDPIVRSRVLSGPVLSNPRPLNNVVGLGIGEKVVLNQLAGALCVKIYVRKKYPEAEIPEGERLPPVIGGVPTDVEEVGHIHALLQTCTAQRRQRQRPAPCGVSVGHMGITAGTIGALVRDSGRVDNGRRYILSNNHVLANANVAALGDAIFQPGPFDGGTPAANRIGALARFVPIDFAGGENSVDCALAEVEASTVLSDICAVGPIRGATEPARDMTVVKHGRTTGLTRGVLTDVEADIRVNYDGTGAALFINTVVIRGLPPTTPFSDGGDSGSVILDDQRRACALLFAGATGADVTFANPIQAALRRLRARLL